MTDHPNAANAEQPPRNEPPFICVERRAMAYEVWRLCTDGCGVYHGPIAETSSKIDAQRIVRALTREAESG